MSMEADVVISLIVTLTMRNMATAIKKTTATKITATNTCTTMKIFKESFCTSLQTH
jgi:hypothetical protein